MNICPTQGLMNPQKSGIESDTVCVRKMWVSNITICFKKRLVKKKRLNPMCCVMLFLILLCSQTLVVKRDISSEWPWNKAQGAVTVATRKSISRWIHYSSETRKPLQLHRRQWSWYRYDWPTRGRTKPILKNWRYRVCEYRLFATWMVIWIRFARIRSVYRKEVASE